MKSEICEVDKTGTYPEEMEIYYAIEVPLTPACRAECSARFYPTLRRRYGASEIDASISKGGNWTGGKLWVKGWG
ncbi:unnamed protein product [Lasius platythorax]|uniref:Uncharacterized protein n=1 Tax=Lasius platythorax TaxID=488582 RepID=A0AAV2NLB7_9HYME